MLLLLNTAVKGQPYYFSHYQVEHGLSNNAVLSIVQDQKGFLWLGTKDGLNRFDGYTFKVFRNNPQKKGSIGGNLIRSLFMDTNGTLWAGCDKGVYQYIPETENFVHLKNTPYEEVKDIKEDKNNNLWIICGGKLYRYHLKTKKLKSYSSRISFEPTSVCVTPDGTVWLSTTLGFLEKYNTTAGTFESFNVFSRSKKPVSYWIETMNYTADGKLLIGTSNQGIKIFDPRKNSYQDIPLYNTDKTELFVRNFLHYRADEYWIAAESGIYLFNLKTRTAVNLKKQYNDPYSLSDNAVYALYRDQEGGIWAGTYFGGLNYFPKQYTSFEKFFPKTGENSISGNAVREICPDRYGNLWIGTEDGGLNKLNLETGLFTNFKPSGLPGDISNINIHGLCASGDTLWIGTFEHGLDLMNIKTGRVMKHYAAGDGPGELKSNFIHSIIRTRSEDIFIGTARGLYKYNRTGKNFTLITEVPDHLFYTIIFEDSQGTIWLGTYRDGLYYYNPKTKRKGFFIYEEKNPYSLSNNRVNGIFEDSRGTMWFATENGLCRFDTGKKNFKRYTTENGLPSNVVFSLLEDKKKYLWISTSKGLVQLYPASDEIKVYTVSAGLLSDQFNYNSSYKDKKGRMYFGSVKGLVRFNPETFIRNTYTPPVYITGLQIDNIEMDINTKGSFLKKSITLTDTIHLAYNQSSFNIDFAALSYTSPQTTEYAYLMEGLDKSWTYLKTNRKAYFTKLLPGTYIFKVKASNSSGIWNPKETQLVIVIAPPFWKSSWAYLLYTIVILSGIYYGITQYHRRIKEKNRRQIEFLEHEKEKEIYQAKIQFFTNVAHEIRTPLTLIRGPMEKLIKKADEVPQIKSNLKIMRKNTDRLLDLTTQLLDFRKTETRGFSLNFVKTDIVQLLKDCFIQFKPAAEQKKVNFKLEVPAAHYYAYIDKEALNKILSNLLNNAITYSSSLIYVEFFSSEQTFVIKIKNDGMLIPVEMREKIFKTFFRLKQTEKHPGTGIGLALARSLVQLHKGTLILDEPENGCNVFTLTMPVHQEIEFDPIMEK